MIAMSRKRGYSEATSIDTATVIAISSDQHDGNSSQVHIGVTPKASMKTKTTTRLSAEVEEAREHDGERDDQARELRLAHHRSWPTIDPTAVPVASWKKPKSTMLSSSSSG